MVVGGENGRGGPIATILLNDCYLIESSARGKFKPATDMIEANRKPPVTIYMFGKW